MSADIFFKIKFFEKFFQEYHQSVEQFGLRSGLTNCLQRLSADDTRRLGFKFFVFTVLWYKKDKVTHITDVSDWTFLNIVFLFYSRSDLDPNCLHMLLASDTRRQKVKLRKINVHYLKACLDWRTQKSWRVTETEAKSTWIWFKI